MTLHELRTVYSVEDAYNIWEIFRVPEENDSYELERRAAERERQARLRR